METTQNKRLCNFELLRIIAMCFVVISHYAQHGLLIQIETKTPFFQFLSMFLHTVGAIGVSIFVLLTGYFMIDKKSGIRHFLNIAVETIFYSWCIFIIFTLFFKNYIVLTPKIIYYSIFPIISGQYWFVSVYLVLYLAIPLLNRLFNVLDKKILTRYLILFIFLWFVCPP